MKKILIITDNCINQINGVVTTFKNIEIYGKKDGFEIFYIDPSFFPHIDCPGYPEVKLSWTKGISRLINSLDPDYIHIATEGTIGLSARLYCDKHNIVYNTSYHTKFPEFVKELYGIPTSISYAYLRWFHKHSGRVLTTTNTMVKELRDHGFIGEIKAWTRGVDRSALLPNVSHTNNKLPIVLYVGRVSKEKNLDVLCELQDRYTIQIVGDGPHRKYLEKTYKKVKFLGYQHGTELANSYIRADVFGFPSRTDTFGIVIIEALSLGTPVAAFLVPGPIDILEQGVTGFMGDNLSQNIDNCLALDRDHIKQLSQKWSWKECWNIFKENLIAIQTFEI